MISQKKIEFSVGVFVLTGIIAAIYLTFVMGGLRLGNGDSYTLKARFTDVTGLRVNTAVRIAGVNVGQVQQIELDRETFAVLVTFSVPNWLELDDDTIASVRTDGLIGDKYVSLQPGGSGITLEPGETLYETESAVDLEGLIKNFAFGSIE